jgi:hypothetical protein
MLIRCKVFLCGYLMRKLSRSLLLKIYITPIKIKKELYITNASIIMHKLDKKKKEKKKKKKYVH